MIILKNTYRTLKRRDYFPMFLYEFYKQHPYNSITVIEDSHYNSFVDVSYIIDKAFVWRKTSQGYEYWEMIYNKEKC